MITTDYHTNRSTQIDTYIATQLHTLWIDINKVRHHLNTVYFYFLKSNLVCDIKKDLNKLTRNWFITINGCVVLIKLILIVATKVLLFWSVENSILTSRGGNGKIEVPILLARRLSRANGPTGPGTGPRGGCGRGA